MDQEQIIITRDQLRAAFFLMESAYQLANQHEIFVQTPEETADTIGGNLWLMLGGCE